MLVVVMEMFNPQAHKLMLLSPKPVRVMITQSETIYYMICAQIHHSS